MIEKDFVRKALVATEVKEEIMRQIGKRAKVSSISIERTPLGERVTIRAQQPGLVIGHGGEIVKGLTEMLRNTYKFENPQIEITDVQKPMLSAQLVANSIAAYLERFGTMRFKAIGHKMLLAVIKEGALGAEIKLGGKLPSEKAKSWRFFYGYLNKCGEVAKEQVDYATAQAMTKPGTVGIKVWIMVPNVKLSDRIVVKEAPKVVVKETVVKLEEAPKINTQKPKVSGNIHGVDVEEKVVEKISKKSDTQKSQTIPGTKGKQDVFRGTENQRFSGEFKEFSGAEKPKVFPASDNIRKTDVEKKVSKAKEEVVEKVEAKTESRAEEKKR